MYTKVLSETKYQAQMVHLFNIHPNLLSYKNLHSVLFLLNTLYHVVKPFLNRPTRYLTLHTSQNGQKWEMRAVPLTRACWNVPSNAMRILGCTQRVVFSFSPPCHTAASCAENRSHPPSQGDGSTCWNP